MCAELAPVANRVTIVELEGLPPKGDISDWLDVDGNDAEKLLMLAMRAEATARGPFALRRLGVLAPRKRAPRAFVVPFRMMRGHITLTAAAPGVGKSTLAVEEAISLVTGEDFLNLDITEKRRVGLINNEETRDEIELLKQASSIGDAAMWKIKYEWLKPGVREREIEAKVHEFMLERGCEIIYDIIVASGGNTSPYRRWATDKLIRQGDLVIVDINAVGPSGYFIDFVRCFKCAGPYGGAQAKMTGKEIDLYREVYDSMYAGIAQLQVGNTSADVAKAFPVYDDDKYGTVTLQQFAHSIGITLYEGMWMSRAYSMKYPAEIKEHMYFAIETFAGHPGLPQTCRLEENVLVTKDGPVIFTRMEHMEEAMVGR